MRHHTRPPRARTAPSQRSTTRPTTRRLPLQDSGDTGRDLQDRAEPQGLVVEVRQDLPRPLVAVAGELDLGSAGLLDAMLDHVRGKRHRAAGAGAHRQEIDVDLAAVSFADSHGLAPVLDGRSRIVATSAAVRRLLRLLGQAPAA